MGVFKFIKLTVNNVPGIDDGFCLEEINPGINIVVGPNGSGKTSTRRALDAVLWPTKSDDHKKSLLNLSAECEYGAGLYRTHLQFGSQPTFKDGKPCDPISFGRPELKEQYHLSLHDLVQDDGRQFAKFIADLSVGGVDLDLCAKEIGAKSKHNSPAEDIKAYIRVKEEIVQLKNHAGDVAGLETELADMRKASELLHQKLLSRSLYSAALEYVDALSVQDAARASLNEFPVQLKRITGVEYEVLVSLETELKEILLKRSKLEVELEAIQKRILASQAEGEIPVSVIASLNAYMERLTDARSTVKDAQLKEKQCEVKVTELRDNIFDVRGIDEPDNIKLSEINSAIIDDFTKIGKELNRIDAEINQLSGELRAMQHDEADDSIPSKSSIESAIHALGLWLQTNNSFESNRKYLHLTAVKVASWGVGITALCLIGIFAGFAAASGSDGSDKLPGMASALLFAAIAVVQVILNLWFRGVDKKGMKGDNAGRVSSYDDKVSRGSDDVINYVDEINSDAIKQYFHTGIAAPRSWTTVDVVMQINLLSDFRSKATYFELVELRMKSLCERLDNKERERKNLITNAETLLSAIQYNEDDLPNLGYIAEFLRQVKEWQTAKLELAEARARAEFAIESTNELAASIDEILVSYGLAAVSADLVKLKSTIKYIEQQGHEFSSATILLQEKNSDSAQLFDAYERLSERRTRLFQSVDLVDGDSIQLKHMCAQYKRYQECIVAVSVAEKQLEHAYDRVANNAFYTDSLILKSSRDELLTEINAMSAVEMNLKKINSDISKIEVTIKTAEASSGIEVALAKLDTLTDRVNQHRESELSKLLGQVIVDHVKDITNDIHRPIVLQRACALFSGITHGKYELSFSGEEFYVVDTEAGRRLILDELSSGTRVQLQIAIRLAFVEEQEKGDKLPLFLDETLGTSDDYRARAIIDSIIMLAKQGRQIFYFTAQTDEVGKWTESIETEGLSYKLFEIDKLRKLSRLNSEAKPVNISPVSLPSVEINSETTHRDYGIAIGVPPIRVGHDDVGRFPLWYVIEDPVALQSLRSVSIETFGPLASIHKNGRNFPVKGFDSFFVKIPAVERLISATIKAINVGHGKAVDRRVLVSSPVSRSKFFEQIVDLADEVGGDASQLLSRLRGKSVSGLQTQLINALEEYLVQEECLLEDQAPLTADGVRAFIVEGVSDDLHAGALSIAEIHSFVDRVNNPPK